MVNRNDNDTAGNAIATNGDGSIAKIAMIVMVWVMRWWSTSAIHGDQTTPLLQLVPAAIGRQFRYFQLFLSEFSGRHPGD